MGTYEELLQEQAERLTRLKAQRGNPSLRVIEARAKKLFADEKVSLPPATQSTAFGGGYLSQDKLIWLVRTLLSWDRFGRDCASPSYGDPELDEWYERWTAIATAKQARRRTAAGPSASVSDVSIVDDEAPQAPSVPNPAGEKLLGDPLTGHASRAQALAFSPDGRFLASTSEDGTVRLWDPYTREPIGGPLVTSRDREVPASDHDAPFEGVPEHLQLPLQEWVAYALSFEAFGAYLDEDDAERTLCLRLRIAVEADGSDQSGSKYRRALAMAVGPRLLDVVDAVLSYKAERGLVDQAQADIRLLTKTLDAAGSAYRVTEAGSGLEKRVIPVVRDAVRETIAAAAAVSAAGLAGDHLARAWRAAYGRSPDAVRAQSEAIWAVESAAHAIIQPNNSKATLGTMLGELKNARHKFSTAIPSPAGNPIAPVEAMMRALWEGRTSRHGAHTGTVPETLEAARAGVHLAAALVQWFVSGAVTRTP